MTLASTFTSGPLRREFATPSSGITNAAGANRVMKSDGVNAVASTITDDGAGTIAIPGTTIGQPVVSGPAGTAGINVHIKNTAPGVFLCGLEVGGDTTVEPGVRPSVLIWRGAGGFGTAVEGGMAIASGSGFPFVGMAANDLGLFVEGGGDLYLGADNTTFASALKIKSSDNSVSTTNGPLTSNTYVQIAGLAGPRWSSGAGSPNAVLLGSPGDLYTNKNGGAATTLYVKESGIGTNTGWVAK
jgi:hypothetical protein